MQAVDPRNKAIKALSHIAKKQATSVIRRLPASVCVEDLKQAGMIGIANAVETFNGQGSLEAYAAKKARFAIFDFLRETHPAGRNGPKIDFVSEDEIANLVSTDNQADEAADKQFLTRKLQAMTPHQRDAISSVFSGKSQKDIATAAGVSESAISLRIKAGLAVPENNAASKIFDPHAVLIKTGDDFPIDKPVRRNKNREIISRMPAGGWVLLATKQAESLADCFRDLKIPYLKVKASSTTAVVIREPSDAQKLKAGRKV